MFTDEQLAVINAREGRYAVIAAAGSGKSATLLERYKQLVISGIPSSEILTLTFTNASGAELAERSGLLNAKNNFRTFHSLCLEIMQKERVNVPFPMCDTIIPVEAQEYQLLFKLAKLYRAAGNFKDIKNAITAWRLGGVSPDQAIDESKGKEYFQALAYKDYEARSRQEGWLDWDQLQEETIALLETNEEVRKRWQKQYVQADEMQDSCPDQVKLLQLISDKNVLCVGDENQAIFAFRGGQSDLLTKFEEYFPGSKKLYLSSNFRSTETLVKFYRDILPVDNGLGSRMSAVIPAGVSPVVIRYDDNLTEAEQVLEQVSDFENTAVLARTNRQLYPLQRMCAQKGIKYRLIGKKDFFDQPECKKIIKLMKEASGELLTVSADSAVRSLIDSNNLVGKYQHNKDLFNDPAENLEDFFKMSKKHPNLPEFLKYLNRLMRARRSDTGLAISTLHGAKGLEFENVFMIGVKQGLLPHERGELAEEKRLFYVGCTRAKRNLYISFFGSPSMFILPFIDETKLAMDAPLKSNLWKS